MHSSSSDRFGGLPPDGSKRSIVAARRRAAKPESKAGRWGIALFSALALVLSCGRLPNTPNDNAWRFLPGTVEGFSTPAFRDGHKCWVYLPPDYAAGNRRYPVLYLNDGHVAFDGKDGMHLHRICDDLIRRGEIAPLIIVAIPVVGDRLYEYSPWTDDWYYSPGGGGDAYLRAIRDSLKPEVDRRYRTHPGSAQTAIGGLSLSGLLASYAGFAYPSTFGLVAAFSPSYWWGDTTNIYAFIREHHRPSGLRRYYHDTGLFRDNSIRAMDALLIEERFIPGLDLMSVAVVGGEHRSGAWEQRFPGMLRFLFPP